VRTSLDARRNAAPDARHLSPIGTLRHDDSDPELSLNSPPGKIGSATEIPKTTLLGHQMYGAVRYKRFRRAGSQRSCIMYPVSNGAGFDPTIMDILARCVLVSGRPSTDHLGHHVFALRRKNDPPSL